MPDADGGYEQELNRNLQRMKNFSALVADTAPPKVGCTPRTEVYRKGKARLYHYAGSGKYKTPILFVPNLGISRPYIFDLQPGSSFIEYITGQGFKMLKPTMELSTGLNLWWNSWNDGYVDSYKALNKWANEYVGFPGGFFRQWVKDFYQQNKMYNGDLVVGGRPVKLKNIRCPLLVVGARQDNIAPPACAAALTDAVGSSDKTYFELPGGHISLIAGRGAAIHCWPKVSGWLAERS